MEAAHHEITQALLDAYDGDEAAASRLWTMVYEELQKIAHRELLDERAHHTLNTTGLVHEAYVKLVEGLQRRFDDVEDKTLCRKLARQAARSVLPNATETKIFVTANARALRHFIELRCSEHAETEIREVAAQVLDILQREAPSLFGDYEFVALPDGTRAAKTKYKKV